MVNPSDGTRIGELQKPWVKPAVATTATIAVVSAVVFAILAILVSQGVSPHFHPSSPGKI